jgi:hypothetical protein
VKATIHHLTWGVFKKFKNENAHCLLASFESRDRAEDCANRIHEECQEDEFFESVDVLPLEVEPPTLTPEVRALIQAASKVETWLAAPSVKTPVLKEMQDALRSALAAFSQSSPEPLTREKERVFCAVHSYKYGSESYFFRGSKEPPSAVVAEAFGIDYDPDNEDEDLVIFDAGPIRDLDTIEEDEPLSPAPVE